MSFDYKRKMVSLGTGAAGTTVVVAHGMSVTPKFVDITWSGRSDTIDASGQQDSYRGRGQADVSVGGSFVHYSVANMARDNVSAVGRLCKATMRNDCVVCMIETTGLLGGKATIQSVDAVNITFRIDVQFSRNLRLDVRMQGGSDITNIKLFTIGMPTAGAVPFTQDFTTPGFTVSDNRGLATFIGCKTATINTISDDSELMQGAACSPTQQRVALSCGDAHAATTETHRYSNSADVIASMNANNNAMSGLGAFSQWITNGFRINWTTNSFQASLILVAVIKGPKTAIIVSTGTGSVGANVVVIGAGFTPVGGLLFGTMGTSGTHGVAQTKDAGFVGSWDSPASMGAHAWFDTNTVATSKTFTRIKHNACYLRVGDTGADDGADKGAMKLLSIDADGCTYQGLEAGSTGTFWTIFFGATGGLPAGPLNRGLKIPSTVLVGHDLYLAVLSKGHTGATDSVSVSDNDTIANSFIKILESADKKASLWWKKATFDSANKDIIVSGGITSLALGLEVQQDALQDVAPHTDMTVSDVGATKTIAGFTPAWPFSRIVLIVFSRNGALDVGNMACTDPGALLQHFQHKALAGGGCAIALASAPQIDSITPLPTGAFTWVEDTPDNIAMTFAIRPNPGTGAGWTTSTFVDSEATQQESVELPLFGTSSGLIFTLDPSVLELGGFWLSGQYGKEHEEITIDRVRIVATQIEAGGGTVGVSFTFDGGLTFTSEVIVPIKQALRGSNSGSGWTTATGQLFQVRVRPLTGNVLIHEINLFAQPRGRAN